MNDNKNFGLYLVETDRYDKPTKEGVKKIKADYRILADSVIEAASIVEAGILPETEEVVVRSEYISHVTDLPTNKYQCVKKDEKENQKQEG